MKALIFTLMLLPLAGSAFGADGCSYCPEMDRLKAEFAKVKPDPMDNATIDHQDDLVEKSLDLMLKVIKDHPAFPAADMRRVIPFLGLVVTYDYQNLVADELLDSMKRHERRFFRELTAMEKEGAVSATMADEIRVAIGVAEAVREDGTDPKPVPVPTPRPSTAPQKN